MFVGHSESRIMQLAWTSCKFLGVHTYFLNKKAPVISSSVNNTSKIHQNVPETHSTESSHQSLASKEFFPATFGTLEQTYRYDFIILKFLNQLTITA